MTPSPTFAGAGAKVGGADDVGGRHHTGAVYDDLNLDLVRRAFEPEDELAKVQDDVSDIFLDPWDARKLVVDAVNAHCGDRDASN